MKKRILILIIILLSTTGCTCEYNLKIENSKFSEEIIIIAENSEEQSNLNNKWQIPIDKDIYDLPGDPSTEQNTNTDNYNYKINNNTVKFNYDFTKKGLINSTAVSRCFYKLTVNNYDGKMIISTSSQANCYKQYPTLSDLIVNIEVDRTVVSHNADSVRDNIYTWNITKENAENKSINIVLNDVKEDEKQTTSEKDEEYSQGKKKKDYTLYIFCGILLALILIGFLIFRIMKKRSDEMDV